MDNNELEQRVVAIENTIGTLQANIEEIKVSIRGSSNVSEVDTNQPLIEAVQGQLLDLRAAVINLNSRVTELECSTTT